jgi:hypothetical protein
MRNDDVEISNFHMHRTFHHSGMILTGTVSVASIIGVAYGLDYLFVHFPWLVFVMLSVVVFISISLPVLLVLWLAKRVLAPNFRDIATTGTAHINVIGQVGLLAPLAASTARIAATKNKLGVTTIDIVLPTFIDCVKSGIVKPDTEEYFVGFNVAALKRKQEEHVYTVGRTSSWITGGKSGSGKTRFEASIVFQMIYKGKIVVVCDPHANKPDGLYNLLKGLEEYAVFALTPDEIVQSVKDFRDTMEYRKELSPEIISGLPDVVLVLEEMRAIYHSDKISDDDKEMILETIERCDVEYRGYKGFCYVTSQSYKVQDVGSTNFRSQISNKLILTMGLKEANFITEDEVVAKKIAKLPKRHVLYVSDDMGYGEEVEAKIAQVDDNIGKRLAAYLRLKNFPTVEQIESQIQDNNLLESSNEMLISNGNSYPSKQLAPVSVLAYERDSSVNRLYKPIDTDELIMSSEEEEPTLITANNHAHKQDETIEEVYSDSKGRKVYYKVTPIENGRVVQSEDRKFTVTNDEIQEVVNAYAHLKIQEVQVSRRKIMERLHDVDSDTWNNSRWHVLAYVCYYKGI